MRVGFAHYLLFQRIRSICPLSRIHSGRQGTVFYQTHSRQDSFRPSQFCSSSCLRFGGRSRQATRQAKVLTTKPDHLRSIPGADMVEKEKANFQKLSSDLCTRAVVCSTHAHNTQVVNLGSTVISISFVIFVGLFVSFICVLHACHMYTGAHRGQKGHQVPQEPQWL